MTIQELQSFFKHHVVECDVTEENGIMILFYKESISDFQNLVKDLYAEDTCLPDTQLCADGNILVCHFERYIMKQVSNDWGLFIK